MVCTIIPQVLVTRRKKKSLKIETENEISTFLALIICKVSSFKIVWSNNFYIKYTYYVFSVYKIHARFPHWAMKINFKYE